jgi:hypothetical protein
VTVQGSANNRDLLRESRAEGLKESERKLSRVENLLSERRDSFLDLDGVHAAPLTRLAFKARAIEGGFYFPAIELLGYANKEGWSGFRC